MSLKIYCEEGFSEENLAKVEESFFGFVKSDVELSLELIFVSEEEIRRLNRETRNIDRCTDVLSYPTMDGILGREIKGAEHPFEIDEEGRLLLGSVAICKEQAERQAREYGHSYERELHYLLVHGILHCLGYDHIVDEDRVKMRTQEEYILQKLGLRRTDE